MLQRLKKKKCYEQIHLINIWSSNFDLKCRSEMISKSQTAIKLRKLKQVCNFWHLHKSAVHQTLFRALQRYAEEACTRFKAKSEKALNFNARASEIAAYLALTLFAAPTTQKVSCARQIPRRTLRQTFFLEACPSRFPPKRRIIRPIRPFDILDTGLRIIIALGLVLMDRHSSCAMKRKDL